MSSLILHPTGTLSLSLFNLYVAFVVPVGIQFACCETLMTRFFKESITASYLKLEERKQIGTTKNPGPIQCQLIQQQTCDLIINRQ